MTDMITVRKGLGLWELQVGKFYTSLTLGEVQQGE